VQPLVKPGRRERGLTPHPAPLRKAALVMRRTIVLLATVALTVLVASGVGWAVTKIGTDRSDTLRGTNRADTLIGKGGNDVLIALDGRDNLLGGKGKDILFGGSKRRPGSGDKNLVGGSGNDAVLGGRGSDNILGENGNDLVSDGPDREFSTDKLSAGDGNDVVGIFNDPAFRDVVTCGSGFDRVFADKKDTIAPDCERVADRRSEFDALFESIPESFFEGLHPDF
jgi:Ca2+-binding RTX toxin-like protein